MYSGRLMFLGSAMVTSLAPGSMMPGLVISPLLRIYWRSLRGTPLMLQLYFIFFFLPEIGIQVPALATAILGLAVNYSAYESEIYRSGLQAIPVGQMEAALAFGMSGYRAYRHVVLPQALLVAVPTLGGYFIGLLKDSSLLSFISVSELMQTANTLVSATFRAFEVYLMVGAIYLMMSFAAAWLVAIVEGRLRPLETAFAGGRTGRLRVGPAAPDFSKAEPTLRD